MVSPLTEAIHTAEKCGNVEYVLKQGSTRFEQNGYIYQALAIFFYIKERKFDSALYWAKGAKEHNTIHTYQIL